MHPQWDDHCEHGTEAFLGRAPGPNGETVDVYFHKEFHATKAGSICLRYGNRPEQYHSPGPLTSFLDNDFYPAECRALIRHAVDLDVMLGTIQTLTKRLNSMYGTLKEISTANDLGYANYIAKECLELPEGLW